MDDCSVEIPVSGERSQLKKSSVLMLHLANILKARCNSRLPKTGRNGLNAGSR
jgi:hypothetical protein